MAWGLIENIVAFIDQVTVTSTGVLQERQEKKVFYCACRHHILEVIVGAAWATVCLIR